MALVFTRPRAWNSIPARNNSIGSLTSDSWENPRSRAISITGSRNPYARAMRVTRKRRGFDCNFMRTLLVRPAGSRCLTNSGESPEPHRLMASRHLIDERVFELAGTGEGWGELKAGQRRQLLGVFETLLKIRRGDRDRVGELVPVRREGSCRARPDGTV